MQDHLHGGTSDPTRATGCLSGVTFRGSPTGEPAEPMPNLERWMASVNQSAEISPEWVRPIDGRRPYPRHLRPSGGV